VLDAALDRQAEAEYRARAIGDRRDFRLCLQAEAALVDPLEPHGGD
jgi:hypothetical protein